MYRSLLSAFHLTPAATVTKPKSARYIFTSQEMILCDISRKTLMDIALLNPGSHLALLAVMDTNWEENDVTINSMHPEGPAPSFEFPQHPNEIRVPLATYIQTIDAITEIYRQDRLSNASQEQVLN